MPLFWSQAMDQVFRREIIGPLRARSGSGWPTSWLGIPHSELQPSVLEMGRADFRVGYSHSTYGTITADDKVTLYCGMNMRSHFYATVATLRAYDLRAALSQAAPTLFVDLGSGPATSGLAFAEHLNGAYTFDYFPVDIAQPMLTRASSLFTAARAANVGNGSIGNYLTAGTAPHRRVIFNASYLFASDTLDITWIVNSVNQAKNDPGVDVVLFVYTNSVDPRAGRKWVEFCTALGLPDYAAQETAQYNNNFYDVTPKTVTFMRAVVRVK